MYRDQFGEFVNWIIIVAERVKLTKYIFSFKIFIEGLEPKHMSITLVLLCKSFSFKLKQYD